MVALAGVAWSVQECYKCSSRNKGEEDCAETDKLIDAWKHDCSQNKPTNYQGSEPVGCRKIIQEIDGEDGIVRECAYTGKDVEGLKRTGNKGIRIFYHQCSDKDNCNAASIPTALSALLLLPLLLRIFQ